MTATTTVPVIYALQDFLLTKKQQIESALPHHLRFNRLVRSVMTELNKNPKLRACNVHSLYNAVLQCAQLGLEPNHLLGHVYLVPFKEKFTQSIKCQIVMGYRGMIELAMRSGKIVSIEAHGVYEHDQFEFALGSDAFLRHVPTPNERGRFVAVYAIAHFIGGGHSFQVLWLKDIDRCRAASKSIDGKIWAENFEEMAKKTAIRKLFKFLPISIESPYRISLDNMATDVVNAPISDDAIDIDWEEVPTPDVGPPPPIPPP